MSNLVIVESPAKAKTIQRYLGQDYEVLASMGHVRDLPKSTLGVDVEHDFQPQYQNMEGKEGVIKELKREAKKADRVYLATDPDREGEAISWHLAQLLNLDMDGNNRVEFNEITHSGVENGMRHPRSIDFNLVDAQQARRILDRLVGYKLSPFLWKKVRRGLSAGRVQSVAVRLVVDREEEIRRFVPQEYWSVDAKCAAPPSRSVFSAKLTEVDGKRVDKMEIPNEETANGLVSRLQNAAYSVEDIKKQVTRRRPAPPFITSTLQQDASSRLGFQARRTMRIAQELYEGVELRGHGAVGLITYMRTDSLRVSNEAQNAAREYILENFGAQYVPEKKRIYKAGKNAQDAHEAIRPSMPKFAPDMIKGDLTPDQFKLYKLIWQRFLASQMTDALINAVSVDIVADDCLFKATGSSVKFDGFTAVYDLNREKGEDKILPEMEKGQTIHLKSLTPNQHFTQAPPRYTEATLIKALEENGIGRPSTYAPTISTITSHQYVEREGKQLKPTSLGEVTTKFMKEHFKDIMDVKFTAQMERNLDDVERGKKSWVATLEDFYGDFAKTLAIAEKETEGQRVKVPDEQTDIICEKCGRPMVIKIGRYGKFLACSGFPECQNTKPLIVETPGKCPKCGKPIAQKKSKRGRTFYGCSGYPACDFLTWNVPTKEICPRCGSTLFQKGGKKGVLVCEKEGCGYSSAEKGK